MKWFFMSTRDLVWLVLLLAFAFALGVERHRHSVAMGRLEAEAREAIHGLAGELWECEGQEVPPSAFSPRTPLPARFEWKQEGALVPEWAEDRMGSPAPPRPRPVAAEGFSPGG